MYTYIHKISPLSLPSHLSSSCATSNVCSLTGSPLTSSRAIQRGVEPPITRPSKRQRHSESTLEAGRHDLAPLIELTG